MMMVGQPLSEAPSTCLCRLGRTRGARGKGEEIAGLLEPPPVNDEQHGGEQNEEEVADEGAGRAEARVADHPFTLGVVPASKLGVGKGISRCFGWCCLGRD